MTLLFAPNPNLKADEIIQETPKVQEEKVLTVEERILETFGSAGPTALKVAKAESGLNPKAYNPEWHRDCQGSYGVFQVGCVNYSGDSHDLYDVDLNIKLAYALYEERGWKPWGVCKNGLVNCGL